MLGQEFFEKLALQPPMNRLHPSVAAFLREYLAGEKVVPFAGRWVINTHFPPYPGRAFDRLVEQFLGRQGEGRQLFSVTWAVTNRCSLRCWHCYNAGRSQKDLPAETMQSLAGELQRWGAAVVTLTGGEPLLRDDLEEICGAMDDRTCINIGTSGWGLTPRRAESLKAAGAFALGVSLDSDIPDEHDRLRGVEGAYRAAMAGLEAAGSAGLYPYVVTVARRELLAEDRFTALLSLARSHGAMEVHLLEPSASGRLAGKDEVLLSPAERAKLLDWQRQAAGREDWPIISTFAYLESEGAFGCGAGLGHLYIDGGGEVCPCNLVPMSFGNVGSEPLETILDRMGQYFRQPRPCCVGRLLAGHIGGGTLPTPPNKSEQICRSHLPCEHELPRFFCIRQSATAAGKAELAQAYDHVRDDYDDFWVIEAGKPVVELVNRLAMRGDERVFEAGCGSGFGTALLARNLPRGQITGVDISEGMLAIARRRLAEAGLVNAQFVMGDALAALGDGGGYDLVFTSWVLGYIPVRPFFAAAAAALRPGGRLAMIVHRLDSPRRETEVFTELVARDPSVLRRQVAFDFPKDTGQVRRGLLDSFLRPTDVWQGEVTFRLPSGKAVLEHLLKSGAGTVFYEAIDPARRDALTEEFVRRLEDRHQGGSEFEVIHEYVACIATRPS